VRKASALRPVFGHDSRGGARIVKGECPRCSPFTPSAVCPRPATDVAIAIRPLDAGTAIELDGAPRTLAHSILEGHRFAVRAIAPGEALLSWGLPFGHALTAIAPGDYVSNASMLESLGGRRLPFALPAQADFCRSPCAVCPR